MLLSDLMGLTDVLPVKGHWRVVVMMRVLVVVVVHDSIA